MTGNSDFKARLARIQSKRPTAPSPVEVSEMPRLYPKPRATLPLPIIGTTLGLALMAGLVGYAWDDIAILFPKSEDGRSVTYLESALRDRMTDEEIKRMDEDPRLQGMTPMQKMILSN